MPTVAEYDVSGLNQFFDHIKIILPLLGYDVFPIDNNLSSSANNQGLLQLHLKTTENVNANAVMQNDGKVRVFKGSLARKNVVPSFDTCAYKRLREELITMGRLMLKDDTYEFADDYEFDSTSAAAAVIMGRAAAGPREWRVSGGKTVKEYLETEVK
ncbi:MAG: DUF4357 domain-containing protein [bacterium]|nr:DUF4357 domain-containing protein [bacterium]